MWVERGDSGGSWVVMTVVEDEKEKAKEEEEQKASW